MNAGTTVLTIDGTQYDYYDLNWMVFHWQSWTVHTITASTTLTEWDNNIYNFSSWTNGNDLTSFSGTFTTPTADTTVTANYVLTTFVAQFAATGLSNFNGQLLVIDGQTYQYTDLNSKTFLWIAGSKHSVQAVSPVTNYDTPAKGYAFSSWTNGNGLVTASGTFTMPNGAVMVTANYVQATVQVTFAQSGLSNVNSGVTILTIDGVNYDIYQVPQTNFQWYVGSTHTVVASTPITLNDGNIYRFSSWTNGNGLTDASGTYTVPNSDATVTANYVKTTVKVSFAVTGLSNINDVTVLTIDGVPYSYYTLGWKTFLWETGSTHSIVASTPITGYDNRVHNFSSWTNGAGLTVASGTYNTPNSDSTLTVNYTP